MKLQETQVSQEPLAFFAEIIVPLAVQGTFTYRIPAEFIEAAHPGCRAVVQFGKNKIYAGLIHRIHNQPPLQYEARYLLSLLETEPLIGALQLKFWDWMSRYYFCSLGEVMNAALPSGLKLESETKIIFNQEMPLDSGELNAPELALATLLQQHEALTISEIGRLTDQKNILPLIKSLFAKDMVLIHEELTDPYRAKKITGLRLLAFYEHHDHLKGLFTELEKAPRQLEILMTYIKMARTETPVIKKKLLESCQASDSTLSQMLKKGIFELVYTQVSRLDQGAGELLQQTTLTESQQRALEQCRGFMGEKQVTLLHGITSSGKTHVYIKLIEDCIAAGKQALYLLPEIALTSQIITRLKLHFGAGAGIYHSRFNENERVETWNKIADGSYQVVIGARSAIFLPFETLGLIIIDEEHDSSFKQYDPAPRYQARDAGIYLGQLHGAPVVLGSATPSIETYYHARAGKYGLVELMERFGGVTIPEIKLVDLRKARFNRKMHMHFSEELLIEIRSAIERREQVILFQNRRGYAPFTSCQTCGYIAKCQNCDVSLTYHKLSHKLSCHYCGFATPPKNTCPVCGSLTLQEKGLGTEKIEEEIKELLPAARIARMDLDTTRKKNSLNLILQDLEEGKVDILVGTQMVSKGLDFAAVSLIGVLNADSNLNFPDFRAFERSFQLLSQVSGRAGRRKIQGKVLIQTSFPAHHVLQDVSRHDYISLYESELQERQVFHYPPFTRLIRIDLKHKDLTQLEQAAYLFGKRAKEYFGPLIIGPEDALVPKVRNWYVKTMLMKIDPEKNSLSKIKQELRSFITEVYKHRSAKGLLVQVDVDPA